MRLDKHLSRKYPDYSRSYLQKLIKAGKILVNNKIVTPHYQLKENDSINNQQPVLSRIEGSTINNHEPIDLSPDKSIKLDIIYEDENRLVINKPAGLIVHPAESTKSPTLVNALLAHYPQIKNITDKYPTSDIRHLTSDIRPGIVHRLDKDASGLMVIAKTQAAFDDLKSQFKNHTIKKEYTALVYGHVQKNQGEISVPIGRSKSGNKMSARTQPKEKDKTAITHYQVIKRFKDFTLLKIQTLTGRTHQIRVHLSWLGHPIVGDQLYKNKKTKKETENRGLFLCADFLEFKDLNNQPKNFNLELPEKLKNILKKLDDK